MIKCVYSPCGEEAEYIYFGKSLCKKHFELTKREAEAIDKAMGEREEALRKVEGVTNEARH